MKMLAVGVAVVLVVVLIALMLYWRPSTETEYAFGQEIGSFPVDELSTTFLNWSSSKALGMPYDVEHIWPDQEYVVFYVSVRNSANHVLYFNRTDDFGEEFSAANIKQLVLLYGEANHDASAKSYSRWYTRPNGYGGLERVYESLSFACGINTLTKVTSLMPNESTTGFLYFAIGEYYNATTLVCRELGRGSDALFSINLGDAD